MTICIIDILTNAIYSIPCNNVNLL